MPSSLPTLLFIPGLMCDQEAWAAQIDAFSGSHRCVVVNHGLCDSITGMAQQAVEQAGAERFSVIGHSMGGRVSMELMRLAGKRVERLALLGTSPLALAASPDGGERERQGRLALLKLVRANGMRAMAEQWAPGMVHPRCLGTPMYQGLLSMLDRSSADIYAAQVHALLNRPDTSVTLRGVDCPVLLICGAQDASNPPAQHEEMLDMLPLTTHADLVVIPECGHMSMMEAPEAVNAAMRAWLGRQ